MSTLVTALTSGDNAITSAKLWTEVASAAPLILTIFVFAFGYYIIRKVLKGGAKGKLRF